MMRRKQALVKGTTTAHPTMEDVARAAGVSRALVSLVMRERPNVSEHRRRLVLDAAARLGYRPNAMARSLASRRTRTVGVLLSDLRNPFFGEIMDGIDAAADELGYRILLSTGGGRARRERASLEAFLEYRTDGVILVSPALGAAHVVAVAASIPVVVVSRSVRGANVDSVLTHEARGARLAVQHLVDLGHRRITHLDGGRAASSAARRAGYKKAMASFGLNRFTDVVASEFTDVGGARAAETLIRRGRLPTAIFAGNDFSAAGVLGRFEEEGIRVPEDVSIIGFDNTFLAGLRHLSLSTVDQPRTEMGRAAMSQLAARMDGQQGEPITVVTEPSLVARRTTGPPRAEVGGGVP